MTARPPLAALLLLALAGCGAPLARGYYRPAGQDAQEAIGAYVEQDSQALVEATCQGAYVNRVSRERTGTVHMQLEVARTRSGDLTLPRGSLEVDVKLPGGGPHLRLPVTQVWSGREFVTGDLLVPAWTRRPFDLFFDDPDMLGDGAPPELLLLWELRSGGEVLPGQCEFVLIPADDAFAPSKLPPADPVFGLRNGYYLPGVQLGERRLREAQEERLHYVFHAEEGWVW